MLVCAVKLLTTKLSEEPEEAENVYSLTCYGLAVCTNGPTIIVKLTVDFESQTLTFTELFNCDPLPYFFVFVDQAVSYNILHRLVYLNLNYLLKILLF